MNAKRLLMHVFATLMLVVAADFAFGWFVGSFLSSHSPKGDYRKISYMLGNPDDDIFLIGPSVCMNSLDPAEFTRTTGLKCFNGGSNDQTLEFCECMLESHLASHKPKCVVLAMRPSEMRIEGCGRLGMLSMYYRCGHPAIDRHLEQAGPFERIFLKSALYRLNTHGWRMLLYAFKSFGELDRAGFVPKPCRDTHPEILHLKPLAPGEKKEDFAPAKFAAFNSIVDMCREADVRLAVVVPPVCMEIPGNVLSGPAAIGRLCAERGVPFADDSLNADYSNKPELFYDTNHLNEEGAKRYTRLVLGRLNDTGFFD